MGKGRVRYGGELMGRGFGWAVCMGMVESGRLRCVWD